MSLGPQEAKSDQPSTASLGSMKIYHEVPGLPFCYGSVHAEATPPDKRTRVRRGWRLPMVSSVLSRLPSHSALRAKRVTFIARSFSASFHLSLSVTCSII